MGADNKTEGTCSVCLRVMQLRGDKPIRHGFSAIGVHHGQTGGYHTGPCPGTRFVNLGISDEGTKWALADARKRLTDIIEAVARLEARPTLTWHPTTYKHGHRVPSFDIIVLLTPDAPPGFHNDGRPTYEWELKKRIAEVSMMRGTIEHWIARYESVIATYNPAHYPIKGAAPKVVTTHLAMQRTHPRFGSWESITCKFLRPDQARRPVKTTDLSKVTCKACKKQMGLP